MIPVENLVKRKRKMVLENNNKDYSFSDVTLSILAYKKSRYLERCIHSVLSMNGVEQATVVLATSTPNEWIQRMGKKYHLPIYVNDGSIEGVGKEQKVADQPGGNEKQRLETKGSGIGADFQFGIDVAKTPLVTVVHQDDIYGKNYLVEMLGHINEEMERGHMPLIAFCDYYELKEEREPVLQSVEDFCEKRSEELRNVRKKEPVNQAFRIETSNRNLVIKRLMNAFFKVPWGSTSIWWRRRILSLGCSICCPSVMFHKKELLMDVFQAGFGANVDWEAWEKLSRKKGAFIYVDQCLMLHRIYRESTTSQCIQNQSRNEEDYNIFCRFWPTPVARLLTKLYKYGEKNNEDS